jgi:hypothetical protein
MGIEACQGGKSQRAAVLQQFMETNHHKANCTVQFQNRTDLVIAHISTMTRFHRTTEFKHCAGHR